MENLLFHGFVSFKHKCHALFKHESHVCRQHDKHTTYVFKQYEQTYDICV